MAVEPPQGCIPVPYRRRRPDKTVLYGMVQAHFETYLCQCNEGTWDGSAVPAHVEREFRRYLQCGILFGSALNEHVHFHCCVIDGVFQPQQGDEEAVRFREAVLTDADIQAVQARVRQRVLRWFARQGYLDREDAKDMAEWRSGGGFSVDASVRIEADDRAGLERLLRYCARPPFALERLEAIDAHRLRYHLPKAQPNGRTELMLTPLELIDRLAALIPPPHTHRHRYHGVLAPNATLRAAVTALAREDKASNDAQQQREKNDTEDTVEAVWRSPARYLWAMLLARIYESAPLACPQCGADMRIIAFVTESVSVRRILEHIGEPAQPPPVAPARPCATQSCFACVPAHALHGLGVRCSIAAHPPAWEEEAEPLLDPLGQPEPDFQFDQTVSW